MVFIAPNLTNIVGASTAAKLIGIAGGLTALSKMPSCNVQVGASAYTVLCAVGDLTCRTTQVLGATRKNLSGFSSTAILQHTGYIFYCGMVCLVSARRWDAYTR